MTRLPSKINLNLRYNNERRKLILRKTQQETYIHVILKVISYLYFWDYDLQVEPSYRFLKYKPDLIHLEQSPNPQSLDKIVKIWIECKKVKFDKLEKLIRYLSFAQIYWFQLASKMERSLSNRLLDRYPRVEKVNCKSITIEEMDRDTLKHSLEIKQPTWIIQSITSDSIGIITALVNRPIVVEINDGI